jgi:hypothetical protein
LWAAHGTITAKIESGKGICDIVLAKVFWTTVEDCLRALALLIALRAVDGNERLVMLEVATQTDAAREVET